MVKYILLRPVGSGDSHTMVLENSRVSVSLHEFEAFCEKRNLGTIVPENGHRRSGVVALAYEDGSIFGFAVHKAKSKVGTEAAIADLVKQLGWEKVEIGEY